jgi:RNA-directed DNA polymerase
MREEWLACKGQNIKHVIRKLNPIIRGWANYFRVAVSSRIFSNLDSWMFTRQTRYANHTHPHKPRYWKVKRYWGKLNLDRQDNWVFGDKETGAYLLKYSWFPIERHALVRGRASPDDPKLKNYWETRERAKAKDLVPSRQKLSQKQKGCCVMCGQSLFNEEELHVHHKQYRSKGGSNVYTNLQLVHYYCHQQLHAKDQTIQGAKNCERTEVLITLGTEAVLASDKTKHHKVAAIKSKAKRSTC